VGVGERDREREIKRGGDRERDLKFHVPFFR